MIVVSNNKANTYSSVITVAVSYTHLDVYKRQVRDNGLFSFSRQKQLHHPTNITDEIVTAAFQLFKDYYKWEHPIRRCV